MTTGLIKPGESQTLTFVWYSNASPPNDAPLTTLTPPPTLVVTAPDGTPSTPSLTQRGATEYWDYTLTPTAIGLWTLQARCQDTNVSEQYAPPLALWVQAESLTDISTDTDLIPAIYAKQTATNGVVLIDGFSPDAKTLHLTQYATHLADDNNALSLTVYVPVDPTDGTPILTLKISNTPTNHAGTLTNYDPTTQLATLGFELTAAHVTPSALPSGGQFSLGILLDNGTLIPISYQRGAVIVDPAGNPAAAVAP